jgi:CheY-like chemotaxis protein
LFLDWQLPGLETNDERRDLLETIRAIHPHIYIIALTSDSNSDRLRLLQGADAYVNRAESAAYLLAALHKAAARYRREH